MDKPVKTVKVDAELHAKVKAKAASGGLSIEDYVDVLLQYGLKRTILTKWKQAAKRRTKEKAK